jgi:hypothetical protein
MAISDFIICKYSPVNWRHYIYGSSYPLGKRETTSSNLASSRDSVASCEYCASKGTDTMRFSFRFALCARWCETLSLSVYITFVLTLLRGDGFPPLNCAEALLSAPSFCRRNSRRRITQYERRDVTDVPSIFESSYIVLHIHLERTDFYLHMCSWSILYIASVEVHSSRRPSNTTTTLPFRREKFSFPSCFSLAPMCLFTVS